MGASRAASKRAQAPGPPGRCCDGHCAGPEHHGAQMQALQAACAAQGIQKVVVGAVIADADGRVLLLRRSAQETFLPGLIELPSGAVDAGEGLGQALAREVLEETGLRISAVRAYLGCFEYRSSSGRRTRQLNFAVSTQSLGPI